MTSPSFQTHPHAHMHAKALIYGLVPCFLGAGYGQYLRWNRDAWLTIAGGFWPMFCILASLAAVAYVLLTRSDDRTIKVSAWLMLTWSWLYVPFWLTAIEVPRSSAVVTSGGRVLSVAELYRPTSERAWLLAGRGGNRIVRNVEGMPTIYDVDVKYKFADAYIATANDGEDLAQALVVAVTTELATVAKQPRAARMALLTKPEPQAGLVLRVCRAAVRRDGPCPLKLSLSPQASATAPGGLWSAHYSEQEALAERHLPTLVTLLTEDAARVTDKAAVFAVFLDLAETTADLAKVARGPHLLGAHAFDTLIARILAAPDGGSEALRLAATVSRLSITQREALRAKALREAPVADILRGYGVGRFSDAELATLSGRLAASIETTPEVALLALETFGPRLSPDLQRRAVDGIRAGTATDALAGVKHLDFASSLRAELLDKVMAQARPEDLMHRLSDGKLEQMLTPAETRTVVAAAVAKAGGSRVWLDFVLRIVPVRAMIASERRAIVDELMFSNLKSALEFVSENRRHLDASDVAEVTRDYVRTVTADFCLHLTHRNASRRIDYFSEAQIDIFRACAATATK